MSHVDSGGRPSTAVLLAFGVLLAGTGLYLVPTLALNGLILATAIAGVTWLGGIGAVWYLYRTAAARDRGSIGDRGVLNLHRAVLEHAGEAHVVVDPDGDISYVSPNVRDVLGVDPDRLEERGTLIDLVHERDRRRALRTFARVRRTQAASATLEISVRRPEGGDAHIAVRALNLAHSPVIGGLLLVLRDITPRKTFATETRHLAYYDALTGLANRRFFYEQAEKTLSLARRHRAPLAVLFLDLDRLKQVNDVVGHEHGDRLLEDVARALRDTLRDSDLVARLGGDEFGVVLTEVRDEQAAGRVAHRVLDRLPARVVAAGHEVAVAASAGVAMFPEDAVDLESLVTAAEAAMHRARTTGSRLQFYRSELRQRFTDELELERDIRQAFEQHEFRLHYQPVFSLGTGEMVGAEALSRWRHITRGMVTAAEFIGQAEKTGLIRSLDRWAIARAIHQRSSQLADGWRGWVAVNLSPHSLRDPELPGYVRETLGATRLEPGSLVLEMPEGAVFRDTAAAADLMWALKDAGAAIALDDYGAGSTSISQLKQLPIDILKLQPDFIAPIGADSGDEQLVEATISIAHGIRARVLAKGVERDDQIEWLRDAGCDFVQGYLVGAPVPAQELAGDRDEPAGRAASP